MLFITKLYHHKFVYLLTSVVLKNTLELWKKTDFKQTITELSQFIITTFSVDIKDLKKKFKDNDWKWNFTSVAISLIATMYIIILYNFPNVSNFFQELSTSLIHPSFPYITFNQMNQNTRSIQNNKNKNSGHVDSLVRILNELISHIAQYASRKERKNEMK